MRTKPRRPCGNAVRGRLVLAAVMLVGCEKTRDVYEIVTDLASNTCGANALPLEDGLTYRVQFKLDAPRATWKVLPKGQPIEGKYDDDGDFVFTARQTLSPGDPDAGTASCTVIREETLEGTLTPKLPDGGTPDDRDDDDDHDEAPLQGEHRIDFKADPNGPCRGANGPLGPFDRLPCQARYTITGTAQEER